MRNPDLRNMIQLRLTLVGHTPEIWREVLVDAALTLADLKRVADLAFEGAHCDHHCFTDSVDDRGWLPRRRWGDRWTMIDLRDPTVVDEETVRIDDAITAERPLVLMHTCAPEEQVMITPCGREMTFASMPAASLVSGQRARPLPCCGDPEEHAAAVEVMAAVDHPEHARLRRAIREAVGPWGVFAPEEFDADTARRAIESTTFGSRASRRSPESVESTLLTHVARNLPRVARAGLERHLATIWGEVPPIVTEQDAAELTNPLRWVIERAAAEELALDGSGVDATSLRVGAEVLGCDPDDVERLVHRARRLRLIYRRSGIYRASKRAQSAAGKPLDLWSLVARGIAESCRCDAAEQLLLLSIADGSLADPSVGVRRCAEALSLIARRGYGAYDGYEYGYGHSGYGGYGERDAERCGQRCDCPRTADGTWHDAVARARRLTESPAIEHGTRLAESWPDGAAERLGFTGDWLGEPAYSPSGMREDADDLVVGETRFLDQVDALVALLAPFGLERTAADRWVVPAILREFSLACLQYTRDDSRF